MRAVAEWLERLSRGLNRLALIGAMLAVAVMLGAAVWQVIARYILAQPPIWTEELARFSMVWGGLLGASCAFRAASDPSLFPTMRSYAGRGASVVALVRGVGALLFVLPIFWFSIVGPGDDPARGYVARLSGRMAETMPVPMIVFGIAVPVSMTLILIHILAGLSRRVAATGDR